MINHIKGEIRGIKEQLLVIDVAGIGFGVHVASNSGLKVGQTIELTTYLHWNQEQGPSLFGFQHELEHTVFVLLIGCSGVGPKLALAVLGDLGADRFIAAIAAGDEKSLSKVSGIGAKKAENIMVQLKHKVAKLVKSGIDVGSGATLVPWHEIEQVLESLNYSRAEIADSLRYLREQYGTEEFSFDRMVRQALSFLAKRP